MYNLNSWFVCVRRAVVRGREQAGEVSRFEGPLVSCLLSASHERLKYVLYSLTRGYHPEEIQGWLAERFPGISPAISTEVDAGAAPPNPLEDDKYPVKLEAAV